jgi:3-oxoacyl-[acyl-carrier-protein] synthase II
MEDKRVAITGAGPVSAIGSGRADFRAGLFGSRSGIGPITRFDTQRYRSRTAGELTDFNVEDYLERPKAYLDRSSELAFAGMSLALEDADLDTQTLNDPSRIALITGSAYAGLQTSALFYADVLRKGPRFAKPFLFPHTYANTAISLLAMDYGLAGHHEHFCGALASGEALLAGFDRIRSGQSDLALVGGFEALSEPLLAGCEAEGCLSPDNQAPEECRPCDRDRNGFVLGEGCGMLALEEAQHARRRGARILAELVSVAQTGGPCPTATRTSPALTAAMTRVLAAARLERQDLDWVCAQANGHRLLDGQEARTLAEFFADRTSPVAVSSLKSRTGETLGAATALQVCAALETLQAGRVPPTLHLQETDRDAMSDGVTWIRRKPREQPLHAALINGLDTGGNALCLILTNPAGSPP